MYHFVTDTNFLKQVRTLTGKVMQTLCHILKEDYDIGSKFYLVGSGAKNLILQNESNPIDLDYNLEIVRCDDINNCPYIKECVRKAFNKSLRSFGLSDCEDSTSALTSQLINFRTGNTTKFSIDVCITYRDNYNNYNRLIHEKTGWTIYDRYYWNVAKNSNGIKEKADLIKSKGQWQLVRQQYKDLKNMHLRRNDQVPSFSCYLEAVNNIYNSLKYQ